MTYDSCRFDAYCEAKTPVLDACVAAGWLGSATIITCLLDDWQEFEWTGIAVRRQVTTVVLCGDHGDCFGEDGLYGHGFYHPKVMEVPMAIFDFKAARPAA